MKRTSSWLIASLLLAQFTNGFVFAAPTASDFWKNTGLKFSDFEQKALGNCYESTTTFLACVDALNKVAENLNPPEVIATDLEKISDPTIGTQLEILGGGLSLYTVNKEKKDSHQKFSEYWKKIKAQRVNHQNALNGIFTVTRIFDHAHFVDILERLKLRVLVGEHKDDESLLASELFNVALGVIFDPHTRILSRAQVDYMNVADNSYVGIGVYLRGGDGTIKVQEVMKDGGAIAAGIRAKDEILAVDGKFTQNLDFEKATEHVTGPEGSTVKLRIKRNDKIFDVQVTRKKVVQENVEYYLVNDTGTNYGFIKFKSFMDKTGDLKIKAAIQSLILQGAKGLILDLRGNLGGLLDKAVNIASFFLGKQKIVSVKSLDLKKSRDLFGSEDEITKLPLVTLIDGGSASASEVFSGALQDYGRSWIVGDRSYGKGSVQASVQYDAAGKIMMFKTIQRFYQPTGRTNQIQGINPDFSVDPFPGATDEDRFSLREEDLFTNALPAIGKPWVQPRIAEVKQIASCRHTHGQADSLFKKKSINAVNTPDYRLLVAEDILDCIR